MIHFGDKRKEAWYIGKDERTDFTNMSLPALVSHWPPQALILDFNLLSTSSHNENLLVRIIKGSPRYLIFSHFAKPVKPK